MSLECANSHVPLELIGLLEGKDALVGVIDVAADSIETPQQVAAVIGQALRFVPKERSCLAPIAAWHRWIAPSR